MTWIQSTNYRPATPLTIEQSKPYIKSVLEQQKATELAKNHAEQIAANIKSEEDMSAFEDKFVSIGEIRRNNQILSSDEQNIAFSIPAESDQIVAMSTATESGASIIVADEIKMTQEVQVSDEEKNQLVQTIRNNFGEDQYSDYIDYLHRNTVIEINQDKLSELN